MQRLKQVPLLGGVKRRVGSRGLLAPLANLLANSPQSMPRRFVPDLVWEAECVHRNSFESAKGGTDELSRRFTAEAAERWS